MNWQLSSAWSSHSSFIYLSNSHVTPTLHLPPKNPLYSGALQNSFLMLALIRVTLHLFTENPQGSGHEGVVLTLQRRADFARWNRLSACAHWATRILPAGKLPSCCSVGSWDQLVPKTPHQNEHSVPYVHALSHLATSTWSSQAGLHTAKAGFMMHRVVGINPLRPWRSTKQTIGQHNLRTYFTA